MSFHRGAFAAVGEVSSPRRLVIMHSSAAARRSPDTPSCERNAAPPEDLVRRPARICGESRGFRRADLVRLPKEASADATATLAPATFVSCAEMAAVWGEMP